MIRFADRRGGAFSRWRRFRSWLGGWIAAAQYHATLIGIFVSALVIILTWMLYA